MPSKLAVSRGLGTLTAGATFEQDLRHVMWRRGRLALGVGLTLTILFNLLGRWVFRMPEPLASPYAGWVPNVYLSLLIPFALGLALVWNDRWTSRQVALIVLGALVVSNLLDAATSTVLYPAQDNFLGAAFFLFLTAALVPWPLVYQVALGTVVTLSYPIFALIASARVPEVAAFWEAAGEDRFWHMHVDGTISMAVLAGVSVLVTRTLYTMRRQLHAASRIGNYVIEGEIGKGGMGKVYRAQHSMIRRPTALKVMESQADRTLEALARFEREVQLSATLSHPNTITIYDFGRSEDATFYYVMEYLDGMDLQRLVEKFGPLPPERTAFILKQVCGSLAEAHARGIIHRDLKPSNIFLTELGRVYDFVKVLDFGLAKRMEAAPEDVQVTQAGQVFGTPLFMAPETAAEHHVDHRSDQYSIGCVAYWMLTGGPPFTGATPYDVIAKHLRTDPLPPSRSSELIIDTQLDSIVLKCLAKSSADRFQDMDELILALDSLEFERPWDGERAREWWNLHMSEGQ
jgi:serine/threonine-protein kinase